MELLPNELRKQIPAIYSQENIEDPIVWVKLFTPDSSWTWYVLEFDGEDSLFGWVEGHDAELGYFSLSELESVKGPYALPVERDIWFKPVPLSQVKRRTP